MKRHILIMTFLTCLASLVYAQQEEQFTQFMNNKEVINPGFVGSEGVPVFAAGFRRQWFGITGAPVTQTVRFHSPLMNEHLGIGFNVSYNNVGITYKWTFAGLYSYRIKVGDDGQLALGLSASVRNFYNDYSDERLIYNQNIMDGSIPQSSQRKYVPNFGLGLYYNNPKGYIGLSAPRLLNSDIDFSNTGTTRIGREVLHSYLMAGYRFPLSGNIDFFPQALVKYAENTPMDFDIYLGLVFNDKINAGISYRAGGDASSFGESLDLLVMMEIARNVSFGASYDFTLSELSNHSNGTFELSMQYRIDKKVQKPATPIEKKEPDPRNF